MQDTRAVLGELWNARLSKAMAEIQATPGTREAYLQNALSQIQNKEKPGLRRANTQTDLNACKERQVPDVSPYYCLLFQQANEPLSCTFTQPCASSISTRMDGNARTGSRAGVV